MFRGWIRSWSFEVIRHLLDESRVRWLTAEEMMVLFRIPFFVTLFLRFEILFLFSCFLGFLFQSSYTVHKHRTNTLLLYHAFSVFWNLLFGMWTETHTLDEILCVGKLCTYTKIIFRSVNKSWPTMSRRQEFKIVF